MLALPALLGSSGSNIPTLRDTYSTNNNSNVNTTVSLGPGYADRWIAIGTAGGGTITQTLTDIDYTLGGLGPDFVSKSMSTNAFRPYTDIALWQIDSGTSLTFTATAVSGSLNGISIAVISFPYAGSDPRHQTLSETDQVTLSLDLDIPNDGFVIGAASTENASAAFSGLTEVVNDNWNGGDEGSVAFDILSFQNNRTISIPISGESDSNSLIVQSLIYDV